LNALSSDGLAIGIETLTSPKKMEPIQKQWVLRESLPRDEGFMTPLYPFAGRHSTGSGEA
jgi:hypothetical protein